MSSTENSQGISNGHWEHTETRASALLTLARLSIAKLWETSHLVREKDDTESSPRQERENQAA